MSTVSSVYATSFPSEEDTAATGIPSGGDVVLPLFDGASCPRTLELARSLAIGCETGLEVMNVICLPEQTPLDVSSDQLDGRREPVERILRSNAQSTCDLVTKGSVRIGRDRLRVVSRAIDATDCGVVVADGSWQTSRLAPLRRRPVETLHAVVDCPVVLAHAASLPETVSSILVPVAGGPHSAPAVDIGTALARRYDAHCELLHVVTRNQPSEREDGKSLLEDHSGIAGDDACDTWLLEADTVVDGIVEQSQYYDLTVIGAPRTPRLRRLVFGSTAETVRENGSNAVVTVWG